MEQQWVGRHLEVTRVLHGKSRTWSHPQQFPTDHSVRSRGKVQSCDQSHLGGDERQDHSYHPSSDLEFKLFHLLVQGIWLFPPHPITVSHPISFLPVIFYLHPEFSSKCSRTRSTGALARVLSVSHLGSCRVIGYAMYSTKWSLPLWSRTRSIQQWCPATIWCKGHHSTNWTIPAEAPKFHIFIFQRGR